MLALCSEDDNVVGKTIKIFFYDRAEIKILFLAEKFDLIEAFLPENIFSSFVLMPQKNLLRLDRLRIAANAVCGRTSQASCERRVASTVTVTAASAALTTLSTVLSNASTKQP